MNGNAGKSADRKHAAVAYMPYAGIAVGVLQTIFALAAELYIWGIPAGSLLFVSWFISRKMRADRLPNPALAAGVFGMQCALCVIYILITPNPYPFRLALCAAVLICLTVPAALSLSLLIRRISAANALLLTASAAFALLLCEIGLAIWSPIPFSSSQQTHWTGSVQPHPELGYVAAPYSVRKNYYPDNPRGYFKKETETPPPEWNLRIDGGNSAQLLWPSDDRNQIRVDIQHFTGSADWDIQLNQPDLPVAEDRRYAIDFQARADSLREAIVAFARAEAPWSGLGLYRTISLTPEWRDFSISFTAEADFDNGRIHFDLGGSPVSVDLRDVRLIDIESNKFVSPRHSQNRNFFVSYRANALGCRGPDYAIPKPDSVTRILALGDSYTQGVGVHEEDTFCAVLSESLNKKANRAQSGWTFEVINAGLTGYDTRQERSYYEHYGRKYQPDIVLVIMVWNDYISYLEESKRDASLQSPGRIGALFRIIGLIDTYMNRPNIDFSENVIEIKKLEQLVREDGGRLGIVIFRDTPPESSMFSLAGPWRQLAETMAVELSDAAIPVIDLQAVLYQNHERDDLTVHAIDGHPNEIAHEIAAHTIESFLYKTGFVESISH